MVAYFAFHAQHGNCGIEAGKALKEEIANLTVERDGLLAERTALEHRNKLLRADQVDPDLLEELARRDLAFAMPNDLRHGAEPPLGLSSAISFRLRRLSRNFL